LAGRSLRRRQRVGLCNDFNTCKLSVGEYRAEKSQLDDSYVALLTIKDKLKDVDADGAVKLLQQIRGIQHETGGTAGAPILDTQEALRALVREKVNKTSGQDMSCPSVAPIRELKLLD
jgi:hypothetical protein